MPVTQKKKAKGLPKRTGKRKARRLAYYQTARLGSGYLHNKLSHIARCNGLSAAEKWVDARPLQVGLINLLRQIKVRMHVV